MAINPSGAALSRAMSAVMQIKAQLVGYDDDDILASIESETNALELLDSLVERVLADKAIVEKARERIARLDERQARDRSILAAMMAEIGQKLERPLATLALAKAPQHPIITDEGDIPARFWKRVLDKVELGKAMRAGETVLGAELSQQTTQLRITTR